MSTKAKSKDIPNISHVRNPEKLITYTLALVMFAVLYFSGNESEMNLKKSVLELKSLILTG